jgi:hypothetical protein
MITFNIKDDKQIIVPFRFARGRDGFSTRDDPDIDDRGFTRGRAVSGLSTTDARGPMLGLMLNHTVHLKVVREDIDDTAPLYITCTEPDVIEIVEPTGGGPLSNTGIFRIKGNTASGSPGKVQVRLGSATGPVLGEIEPHVFSRYTLPITPHRVRIDTSTATGTRPNIPVERILRRARAIWWPCGIEIRFDPATRPIVDDNIQLGTVDVVRDPDVDNWAEVKRVLGLQRQRLGLAAGTNDQAINWYIINRFTDADTVGLGIRRQLANTLNCDPGIFTTANGVNNDREIERVARTVAHEIGHFLTLEHVQNRHADDPVEDTYGRRQLMFPISWLPASPAPRALNTTPRIDDVGYGREVRGCLFTLKNHPRHATDKESTSARTAIRRGQWF